MSSQNKVVSPAPQQTVVRDFTFQNDMCIAAIGLLSGEEEPRYKYLWNFSQVYQKYVNSGIEIPDEFEWFTDNGLAGHHDLSKIHLDIQWI